MACAAGIRGKKRPEPFGLRTSRFRRAFAHFVRSMLRECLIVRVTARWCFAQRPVYLRGRILPVSVTKRTQACGSVKGICAGVGVCCFCPVALMSWKGGWIVRSRRGLSTPHWRRAPRLPKLVDFQEGESDRGIRAGNLHGIVAGGKRSHDAGVPRARDEGKGPDLRGKRGCQGLHHDPPAGGRPDGRGAAPPRVCRNHAPAGAQREDGTRQGLVHPESHERGAIRPDDHRLGGGALDDKSADEDIAPRADKAASGYVDRKSTRLN